MAKFAPNPVLDFIDDIKNDYIEFQIDLQINFEEHEKNIEWEFKVNFNDKNNDDALIYSIKRYITPKKSKIKQKFIEKASREVIKIDMNKIDVSMKMEINPKETP